MALMSLFGTKQKRIESAPFCQTQKYLQTVLISVLLLRLS